MDSIAFKDKTVESKCIVTLINCECGFNDKRSFKSEAILKKLDFVKLDLIMEMFFKLYCEPYNYKCN